jgi:hypothetical protein
MNGQGRSSYAGQSNTQASNAQDGRAAHVGGALIPNMHSSVTFYVCISATACVSYFVSDLLCNPRRVFRCTGWQRHGRCWQPHWQPLWCGTRAKHKFVNSMQPIFCMRLFKLLREVAAALPWIPASGCCGQQTPACAAAPVTAGPHNLGTTYATSSARARRALPAVAAATHRPAEVGCGWMHGHEDRAR